MEHQILPRGACYSDEDQVPYIGCTDYLEIPFLKYPKHAGYTFLIENDNVYVDEILLSEKLPTASFLQTWLFFGLLREILGSALEELGHKGLYRHSDFIRSSEVSSPQQSGQGEMRNVGTDDSLPEFVTTARLIPLLEQWCHIIQPELPRAKKQYSHLLSCTSLLRNFMPQIESRLPLNSRQSLYSTLEVLSICVNRGFSGQSYSQGTYCVVPVLSQIWTVHKVEKMRGLGWCPYQAIQLKNIYPAAQICLYLEKLDKRKTLVYGDRHQDCDISVCRGLQSPQESQHRYPQCGCNEVDIEDNEWEKLLQILDSNKIPVLCLSRSADEVNVTVAAADQNVKYTAISHVWADGLGNKQANALRQCQVNHIYDRLNNFQTPFTSDRQEVFVWIDTICCPLKPPDSKRTALALMRETYKNAENVLVFDAELEMTDHTNLDYLEILARIACSTWNRRLWTLQEGFLAQNIWIQFQTKAINMDRLMIEHNDVDESIQSGLLHSFMRNNFFGIRRNRAQNPPNPRWGIHPLAITVQRRSVSVPSDEPLCLSTLFGLPLESVIEAPSREQRMQKFWQLLSDSPVKVPPWIIFSTGPKISTAGYQWAPATVLSGNTLDILASTGGGLAEISSRGLNVTFPGIQLSAIHLRTFPPDMNRPTWMRDDNGKWYRLAFADMFSAHEVAKEKNIEIHEALLEFQSPFTDDLPADYSRYAIIVSKPHEDVEGPAFALLVKISENRDGIIFASYVRPVWAPMLMGLKWSRVLESTFQYVQQVSNEDDWNKTPGMGREILERDPSLSDFPYDTPDPAFSLQELAEKFLDGRYAVSGQLLPATQQWCLG